MTDNFKNFNLNEQLIKNLDELKYVTPTPIQIKGIPIILEKKNFLGLAQTGTGKTATFILPILNKFLNEKITVKKSHPKALILAPTRELCTQIGKSVESYSKHCGFSHLVCFGGVSPEPQIEALKEEVDILVATPGRLLDLVLQKNVFLDDLEFLVIDEADNILEMGLNSSLKEILKKIPKKSLKQNVQKLFFSATLNSEIKILARDLMEDFEKVEVESEEIDLKLIDQRVMYVLKEHKIKALVSLLNQKEVRRVIIFTNSKVSVDNVVRSLVKAKLPCWGLHSGKSNTHREKAVNDFRIRQIKYLVATDLAARGLDFEDVTHVINFEMPKDFETYTHRVGRIGRAKKKGIAISMCGIDERLFFKKIEENVKLPINTESHDLHSNLAKNGGKTQGKSGKRFRPKKRIASSSGYNNRMKKKK